MQQTLFHLRRELLTSAMVNLVQFQSWAAKLKKKPIAKKVVLPRPSKPSCPEDFRPLENACFQDPFDFYKMIRDDYPVYELPNGIFCISRYQDIIEVSRNHEQCGELLRDLGYSLYNCHGNMIKTPEFSTLAMP